MQLSDLYDQDFYAWTKQMAQALRDHDVNDINREHLLIEIESLGARDCRELKYRLTTIITHFLKCEWQTNQSCSHWFSIISEQRIYIQEMLIQSPSLKGEAEAWFKDDRYYRKAVNMATREIGISNQALPYRCPYTLSQVLDDNFYPKAE